MLKITSSSSPIRLAWLPASRQEIYLKRHLKSLGIAGFLLPKPITQKNQRAQNPKLSEQIGWPRGEYVGYASYTRLLEQEVFKLLRDEDEYALLACWLELEENVSDAYEGGYAQWQERDEIAFVLAGFLSTAGCYGDFTEAF